MEQVPLHLKMVIHFPTYTYEVVIDWPDTNGQTDSNQDGISDDATYANSNYSNTVQVHVTGTQVKDAEPYVIK